MYPFGSIVINFGVSTDCHRDPLDAEGICVVIPFTRNCEGGGLCLYEACLVFDLQSSDVLIFPSALLTHVNLHIDGLRASFVLHADKHRKTWVDSRNNWKDGEFGIRT
jgi:hypothetical protein